MRNTGCCDLPHNSGKHIAGREVLPRLLELSLRCLCKDEQAAGLVCGHAHLQQLAGYNLPLVALCQTADGEHVGAVRCRELQRETQVCAQLRLLRIHDGIEVERRTLGQRKRVFAAPEGPSANHELARMQRVGRVSAVRAVKIVPVVRVGLQVHQRLVHEELHHLEFLLPGLCVHELTELVRFPPALGICHVCDPNLQLLELRLQCCLAGCSGVRGEIRELLQQPLQPWQQALQHYENGAVERVPVAQHCPSVEDFRGVPVRPWRLVDERAHAVVVHVGERGSIGACECCDVEWSERCAVLSKHRIEQARSYSA